MTRKIAIFTGGRQDYYLLKPLILELLKKPVKTGFFLAGTHLSNELDSVYRKYFEGKITNMGKIVFAVKGNPQNIIENIDYTAIEIAKILKKIKPDILLLGR